MRILILGAGALGSLLGARLSEATETVLFSRNREHIQAIREYGLVIEELDGSERRLSVPAASRPDEIPTAPDLVITVVKAYDTSAAVQAVLPICRENTLFLSLQNGLGNLEQIVEAGLTERALAGITAQGATFLGPGRVRHGGLGPTHLGEPDGPISRRVRQVVDIFNQAGLQATAAEQARRLIWRKLIINVGINPITAISRVPNGWIADRPEASELASTAVEEAVAVARASGFDPGGSMTETVMEVARATASNISSMHQDIRSGKRTEIESINGAVVQRGEKLGLATPVNRTLTSLVQLIERRNQQEDTHG